MRPSLKRRELSNYIKRRLGAPVVNIAIDPVQIDDAIDMATDKFGEFAGGTGNVETLVTICPQLVFFDGTGTVCQPGPTGGRWRKATGTIPTTAMPATGDGCPLPPADLNFKYGGPDGNPMTSFPVFDANGNICPDVTLPGPGWCGTGIQDPHCFTETEETDPNAIGPFWVEGDTTVKPRAPGFIWRTVYDVPRDILAVHDNLSTLGFGTAGATEDNALFSPYYMMFQGGGSWGMQNSSTYVDNKWGYWNSSAGGTVDMVSWYMGYQTLETYRQMFQIKMVAQLNELEHKVRIMPPPGGPGIICFGATRRVTDEAMYAHQWVKDYAVALTMQTVGMNMSKYGNITMPNGGSINGEMYLARGDALVEKLETQLIDQNLYSLPPDFYMA